MQHQPDNVRIYDDISAAIRSGRLPPGAKIPSISELEAEYGCSATPVKQALRRLHDAGLIESRPGRGNFVRQAQTG